MGSVFFWALFCLVLLEGRFCAIAQSVQPVGPKIIFSQSSRSLFADSLQPPAQVKFFVRKIMVEGNTALTPAEIEKIVAPFEGKELDLETLKHIAQLLTQAYARKGYVLARALVPPQTIENDVIRISVMQGRIGTIKVEGNHGYTADFIQRFLAPGLEHGVLQSDKFERALMILNEFPDLHVESYFKKGKESGTTDVVVATKDKTPLHEEISYNNYGDRFLGRTRMGLEISDGNITGSADSLGGQMTFPFPSTGHPYIVGTFSRPFGVSGTRFTTSYASSEIQIGQEFESLGIQGSSKSYTFAVSHPLVRRSTESSNFIESLSVKNSTNFLLDQLRSEDKIREVALEYNHRWASQLATTFMDFSLSRGLGSWLGGMEDGDPLASRAGADDNFIKMNVTASRVQRVFGVHTLFLRGSAQWAGNQLVSLEQYSLGGADSVRGYGESEALGDVGWNLSGEYRVPLNDVRSPNSLHLAIFLDTGYTSIRNSGVGQTSKRHLTGAGFGVRFIGTDFIFLRADVGYPLDPAQTASEEIPRLYLQGSMRF